MATYWRTATYEDAAYVTKHMRQADVEEVRASGSNPSTALTDGLDVSAPCYTLQTAQGVPVALLGVRGDPSCPSFGLIWLLGTDGLKANTVPVIRHSKPFLSSLETEANFDALWNYTYVKNTLHHRWLRWLGFKFINRVGDFYEFAKIRGT